MANIFTGILDLDTVPPAVSDILPAPLSTGASHATSISFKITDVGAGVDLASLDITVSSIPAIVNGSFAPGFSGTINTTAGGYAIEIIPSTEIGYGKTVIVDLYVQDLAGIFNFTSETWQFSTEADVTPPQLDNFLPAINATDVAVSSSVSLDIIDLESGVDATTISLDILGSSAILNGVIQSGFSGSLVAISGGYTLTIAPTAPFGSHALVNLSLSVENNIGLNTLFEWSFTAADIDAPVINAIEPLPGSVDVLGSTTIHFTVTDEIDLDILALNTSIAGAPAIVAGVIQPGFSGSIVDIHESAYTQFDVNLTRDIDFGSYQHVTVAVSAADASGNSSSFSWEFITADIEAPLLISPLPANGSVDAPLNTTIFVQVIDNQSGVDTDSINMTIRGEQAIAGGVYQAGYAGSIDAIPGGYEIHIHPLSNYDSFHVIPVELSAADISGNSASLAWSFRTIDEQQPVVSNIQPVPGSSGVAAGAAISIDIKDFESGIDLATVSLMIDGSAAVSAGLIQAGYSGAISAITNGYSLLVSPDTGFGGGATVPLSLSVSDVAGNNTSISWNIQIAALTSYVMRAFRSSVDQYVYWSSPTPDSGAANAPYPVEQLSDIVVATIADGVEQTYGMRGYHAAAFEYVYWISIGEPDGDGLLAPVPAADLTDISVSSIISYSS